jgi:sulfite exporter TauE/SafE
MVYQQAVSILSGIILLLLIIPGLLKKQVPLFQRFFNSWVKLSGKIMKRLYGRNTWVSNFGIGILNGLLPCGLVYIAAAASLNASQITYSLVYMALFFAGTLPIMMGIGLLGTFSKGRLGLIQKPAPYLTLVLALLFILRGMSLNIPYISPVIKADSKGQVHSSCSHCNK